MEISPNHASLGEENWGGRNSHPTAGPPRDFNHFVVFVAEFLQGRRASFCREFFRTIFRRFFRTPSLWNDRLFIGFWWPLGGFYGH